MCEDVVFFWNVGCCGECVVVVEEFGVCFDDCVMVVVDVLGDVEVW